MSLLPRRVSLPFRLTAGSTLLLSCLATSLAAQETLYWHVGKPTASYSRAFAGGGDFDGDGYADYLAGLAGGGGGQLAVYAGATAQALRVQRNHAVDDTLGACLAVLGDLDGDGAADYMAGAPTDDRNGAGAGAAHVFSGRTHARLVSYYGSAAGDGLGACAALGDLDGDGIGDFAFAAPGHDFAAPDAGVMHVMSGRTRLVLRSHHGGVGQQLGRLLVAVGDVDRDGVRDYAASIETSTGRALDVFSGRSGLRVVTFALPLSAQIERVVATGDLDGDGQPDLVVSAPASAGGAGVVFALSGANLGVLHQVVGVDASDVGDVDRDGRADFAVAEAFLGTIPPRVLVYSGRTQAVLWSFGFYVTDRLAVAAAGDVNRDGQPDLLVRVGTPGVSHLAVLSPRPAMFTTSKFELDLAVGGVTNLQTRASAFPGRSYLVLASASGTNPGVNIGTAHLPLNFDGLFGLTLGSPNRAPYALTAGVLGFAGNANSALTLPPGLPNALSGLTLQHAVVILDGSAFHASSSAPLTLRGVESPVRAIEEDFTTNVRIDVMRSAFGVFGRPARVGGTGMHGDFDHRMGTDLGGGVFEFDLERDTRGGVRGFAVPAANTLSGREEFVVDGMFQFATLQVPAGITVRFRGTKPVRFLVRGQCQLDGVLDVSAVDSIPLHLGFYINGQEPVRPGAGGGRGGRGANASTGTAPSDGGNGQDVQVAASHAYAGSAVGTGGRGSTQFPTSNATVTHSYSGVVCTQMTAGGAGGGNGAVGAAGNVLRTPNNVPGDAGPPSIAGTTFQFFPLPNPYAAFVHFAAGGAGGGGGGSNIYSHTVGRTFQWRSGAAGGGGGGVLAIRAGGALLGGANGQVLARGGEAYRDYQSVVQGSPAPGGGGAGGSILLQSPARITLGGLVDASGGRGGFIAPGTGQPLLDLSADGGDGGAGFLRVESAGSVTIGTAVPPLATPNRGPLLELDPQAGQQSTWYTTGLALTPRYLRYEILADVNQVPTRFSDDPAIGQPALFGDPGAAVWFKLQGADIDASLLPAPGTVRPWRDRAADLTADRTTGFRFVILGNGASVAIRSVRVIFEQ